MAALSEGKTFYEEFIQQDKKFLPMVLPTTINNLICDIKEQHL